jgi:hypothetical protein
LFFLLFCFLFSILFLFFLFFIPNIFHTFKIFPFSGGLDGNTGGSSLLSSEAPSHGEITSVPTL